MVNFLFSPTEIMDRHELNDTIRNFFNLDSAPLHPQSDHLGMHESEPIDHGNDLIDLIGSSGKSETSGMPAVEDGLSSSQGSDTEDNSTMGDSHRPSEILKRR